jgi:hypothetical protein
MCSVLVLLSVGACGDGSETGSGDGTDDGTEVDSSAALTTDPADSEPESGEALPTECALPPFTATVQREGSDPAGSDDFEVVDAVTLPIPIVPDPSSTVDAAETSELAATTDLLGYSMIFGDEPIRDATAGFGAYEPVEDGRLRAVVSVFPASSDPLVAGDVVTDGRIEGLSIPLPTIGMDLKTSEDDTNVYLDSVVGQVEVLAVTAGAVCLDIDLSWTLDQPDGNTLTIEGVVAGRLLDRATSLTLG